jgi:eukaryotic-like serine/threonine-protein kinase
MIDEAPPLVPAGLAAKQRASAAPREGRLRSPAMRAKPIPFGKYYLLDRVNTGGMAEVFRAKAFGVEGFERIVAVKRILPTIAADTDFISMFIDEAKLAVQLNHANIAQIFDLGKVRDSYFIALEYVHGKDLRAVYEQARERGHTVPFELACFVICKICEGLDYAHRKRDQAGRPLELVHRDVSPQNILISFDGDVKLIDFGIAKAVGKARRTRTGVLKGKFGYLSPEQVRGEEVDQRSDVFGIGIVLHELLTGERLFVGDSDFSTIEKVRNGEIVAPRVANPQVPDALSRIAMKALSRDLEERYQSALELHDALQDFLHQTAASIGKKELSAWMQAQFPADAARDPEEVGDLEGAEALADHRTEVPPMVEPTESKAVFKETRDAPEEAKPKHPATILGMPAVLPPADLAAPLPTRSSMLPPPPPRGGTGGTRPPASPGQGRSVPPPPPRTQPPAPPGSRAGSVAPGMMTSDEPSQSRYPSPIATSMLPAPIPRTVPPAPPVSGTLSGSGPATRGALLNMDWEDDELSTQIYDRPNDEDADGDPYENVEAGFHELPYDRAGSEQPYEAGAEAGYSEGGVATYVPGTEQAYDAFGPPGAPEGVHVSPRVYGHSEGPARVEPVSSLRPGAVTQTMTMTTDRPLPDRARNPLYGFLAVAAVLLLCFVGYVFLSRTEPGVVQLTASPADATLLFDGKPVGKTSPFVVTGVSPTEMHTLELKKAGFRPWSQEVQVQPGKPLTIEVTLQPSAPTEQAPVGAVAQQAPGGFSIETSPAGAAVVLDGQELPGVTPLRVGNLLARAYDVKLRLSGFREHAARVEVRPGVDQSLPRVVLQPERVRVRVTSEPAGAEATVVRGDERRTLGRTPVDVTLDNDGSRWSVEVVKSGYESSTQPIVLQDGAAELSLRAVLTRVATGEPAVAAPSTSVETPRAPAAAREEPRAAAPASGGGQGTLRINSRPWSQVVIDGRPIGNTPQMNVALPAGTHRVTLVNPEFNLRRNLTITIKPGQVETQIITLQ